MEVFQFLGPYCRPTTWHGVEYRGHQSCGKTSIFFIIHTIILFVKVKGNLPGCRATLENLLNLIFFSSNSSQGRIFMYYLGTDSLSQIVASSGILNVSSTPLTQSYSKISYMKAVLQTTGWGLSQPTQLLSTNWDNYRYARSQESFYMLKPLSDSLMAGAYNLLLQNQNASIKVHPYGGVIAEKANTDTAFPWRNSLGLLQLAAGWAPGNATQEATALNWLNKMSPLLSAGMNQPRAAYINYMEEGLKNWQSAYYGANYKKLQQVKSKYDPLNFFKGVQSIDPAKAAPCKFQPCKLN